MTQAPIPGAKQALSEVKKLRGWLSSDSSQHAPLVDALNELTALRLLAHAYPEAVEDAQDAMTQAHKLVMSHGAVGPYTPADDAGRFLTSMTHVAVTQVGLSQAEAAGQTAAAAYGWMAQLPLLDLAPEFAPRTAVWLLSAVAEGALAVGDLARARAYAQAAQARADEGEVDARLAADVAALVSRCAASGASFEPLSDADALVGSTRTQPVELESERIPLAPEPEPITVAPEPVVSQPEQVAVQPSSFDAEVSEPTFEPTEPTPVAEEPYAVPVDRVAPTEPAPVDPIAELHNRADDALAMFRERQAAGDRAGTLAASEEVVALVRQLAATDEVHYGPTLVGALHDLAEARRRGGDWWGSRGPSKEAKQLAKRLGL